MRTATLLFLFIITVTSHGLSQNAISSLKEIESTILSRKWQDAFGILNGIKPIDLEDTKKKWILAASQLESLVQVNVAYNRVMVVVGEISGRLSAFDSKKATEKDLSDYLQIKSLFLQLDYAITVLNIDLMLQRIDTTLSQRIVKLDVQLTARIKKVDVLIEGLDARIETLKKEIVWENKAFMTPNIALINLKLDQINRKQPVIVSAVSGQGNIYAGVLLFTGQSVGFTVQYAKPARRISSYVAGLGILYLRTETVEQFGPHASIGPSFRFRNTYRLSFLGEVAYINQSSQIGARVMAYNRSLAVGVGYVDYLGTGVTLLISLR